MAGFNDGGYMMGGMSMNMGGMGMSVGIGVGMGGMNNMGGGGGAIGSASNTFNTGGATPAKKMRSNVSLTPLSIRQFMNATQNAPDDTFTIDGKELGQITIVGIIRKVSPAQINTNYEIEDGTGVCLVIEFTNNIAENPYISEKRAECREGVYVRVVGIPKVVNIPNSVEKKRQIQAFDIRVIADFNEITFHFLEVLHVHLYNTRGGGANNQLAGGSTFVSNTNTNNFNNPYMGGGGDFGNAYSHSNMAAAPQPTLNDLQKQIIQICKNKPGVSSGEMVDNLRGTYSESATRTAIDFLIQEGHIYQTDDDAFNAADRKSVV